jgi:hypothetical protein
MPQFAQRALGGAPDSQYRLDVEQRQHSVDVRRAHSLLCHPGRPVGLPVARLMGVQGEGVPHDGRSVDVLGERVPQDGGRHLGDAAGVVARRAVPVAEQAPLLDAVEHDPLAGDGDAAQGAAPVTGRFGEQQDARLKAAHVGQVAGQILPPDRGRRVVERRVRIEEPVGAGQGGQLFDQCGDGVGRGHAACPASVPEMPPRNLIALIPYSSSPLLPSAGLDRLIASFTINPSTVRTAVAIAAITPHCIANLISGSILFLLSAELSTLSV